MIPAAILGTGSALPERKIDTQEIAQVAFPGSSSDDLFVRTGISSRCWLDPSQTVASLATTAVQRALEGAGLAATELRRIILVTSTGGDHMIPATANDVAGALGLDDTCDAFDLNNSCAGFLSAFDIGARSVATGLGPVAVVAVESFSRYLSPEAPRAYVVLGDAAASVILGNGRSGGGVLASYLRNSGRLRGKMNMPYPGAPGARPFHDFPARNAELEAGALHAIRHSTMTVLDAAGMTLDQIAWFLPHQPNGNLFNVLVSEMGVSPDRVVPVVQEIGSVGAASVPTSLDRLMRTKDVHPGDCILMASVGAGTAYGAILYKVAV